MNEIDIDQLLQPVSSDSPCGPNLEYEPEFQEMEQAFQGKPDHQIGDEIQPAEPPDWKAVKSKALALLSQSKDLRLGVYLACAALHTDGWGGFHKGLELVASLLDGFWDDIHPELDPSDGFDPAIRVNTLLSLCDPVKMLPGVRTIPLVVSKPLGRFGLRDVQIAKGDIAPVSRNEGESPALSTIEAAFHDCDGNTLQAAADAVDGAMKSLDRMDLILRDRIDVDKVPDFSPLYGLLQEAGQVLSENLARRGLALDTSPAVPAIEADEAGEDTETGMDYTDRDTAGRPAPAAAPSKSSQMSGEIRSREDVIRALDKVCQFFYRNEPSSPIPILLERAKRLVSKDFMQILRNLVPDGVTQAEMIRGPEEDEDASYGSEEKGGSEEETY